MSETKLLYPENSYLKEFDARIIKLGPKYAILDRTAFYPEGGGQPGDTGKIVTEDKIYSVTKVLKRGKQVFHYLDDDIYQKDNVRGVIDWDKRFWNMRRHSGEHLLTGLFESLDSGPKVFSNLEQLDFKPSKLNEDTIRRVSDKFNSIVDANVPVQIFYLNREDLDVVNDERQKSFLEKIPQNVKKIRIVKIGTHAQVFCMGTHVKSTGEIGGLKRIFFESKKKKRKIVFFELFS
jgi:Ser-tRNA(Ala) deacylase AlaX